MPLWDKLAEMYREYDEVTIAKMDATKNEAKGIHGPNPTRPFISTRAEISRDTKSSTRRRRI